jgi:hypothetical protein
VLIVPEDREDADQYQHNHQWIRLKASARDDREGQKQVEGYREGCCLWPGDTAADQVQEVGTDEPKYRGKELWNPKGLSAGKEIGVRDDRLKDGRLKQALFLPAEICDLLLPCGDRVGVIIVIGARDDQRSILTRRLKIQWWIVYMIHPDSQGRDEQESKEDRPQTSGRHQL